MKPAKRAIIAAVSAIVLVSGWQYYSRQERGQQVTRLRAENDQMRRHASQRHDALIAQVHTVDTAKDSVTPTSTRAGLQMAGTEYRNEGQATPANALQTLAWACDHGEMGVMEKLIVFDPAAREKLMNYLASQPTEGRPQTRSLENLAATLYISEGMKNPYPVSEILQLAKFESLNPERVVLRLPGANGNGYEFQHSADGWKLAVTASVVDDYIEELSQHAVQH